VSSSHRRASERHGLSCHAASGECARPDRHLQLPHGSCVRPPVPNSAREVVRRQGHDLDFTDVIFDGGDFTGAVFTTDPTSKLHGRVDFAGAKFTGGTVNFGGAI
jgi:hypothetical protein